MNQKEDKIYLDYLNMKIWGRLIISVVYDGAFSQFCRAVTSGILNFDYLGLQTVEHVLRVCRTWDSIISLMPKGGETIWGDLDSGPNEWSKCDQVKRGHVKHIVSNNTYNCGDMQKCIYVKEPTKYGGINSFGKAVSQLLASLLSTLDSEAEVPYDTLYFSLHFV